MSWIANNDTAPLSKGGSIRATVTQVIAFAVAIASGAWYVGERLSGVEQRLVRIETVLKVQGGLP